MNDIQSYVHGIEANLKTHLLYKKKFGVIPTDVKQWDDNETCLIDKCAQMLLFWSECEVKARNEPSAMDQIMYISENRVQLLNKLDKLDAQIQIGILKRYNVLIGNPDE